MAGPFLHVFDNRIIMDLKRLSHSHIVCFMIFSTEIDKISVWKKWLSTVEGSEMIRADSLAKTGALWYGFITDLDRS